MKRLLIAAWLAASLAGCSTHQNRLADVRRAYYAGDAPAAEAKLDAAIKANPREADVLKLDRACVLLGEGRAKEAEQLLREVRGHFDEHEQKAVGEVALSMLTDDQAVAYPGEDHERVLIRAYLALANLMAGGGDAGAYALQVAAKQQEIIERAREKDGSNPKASYPAVAVGAYLHGAIREATHTNYDDAARSYEKVCQWMPSFAPAKLDLQRAKSGRHSQKGHGVVHVVALVGQGPYKVERAEVVTQAALLIADRILSATGKHTLPPTIAPVKVPAVVVPENPIAALDVFVGQQRVGRTETVTDVGAMAKAQCDAALPNTIARAVARRIIKKASVVGLKELTKTKNGSAANLLLDVGGVVWEATESADTRCWGLLPDKIQVLRVELPAGRHELALRPNTGGGKAVAMDVADGRDTYILASFPAGKVTVSRP